MKTLLLILLSFSLSAQSFLNKVPDDVKHFYGSVLVYEVCYSTQSAIFKKHKPFNRLAVSALLTAVIDTGKEVFDTYRCNRNKRTGFSKRDLMTDGWAVLCYTTVRFAIIDTRQKNRIKIDTLEYLNLNTK